MRVRAFPSLAFALAVAACGPSTPHGVRPLDGTWPVAVAALDGARPGYERVVLVTIDTLRADHVSSHGYPRRTTPFLDSLAERGVLFTNAQAAISHTAPSHATMLTGLVPSAHGVRSNGGTLAAGALDLAKVFATAGFETAAFLNVRFLSGIARSFGQVTVRALGEENGRTAILGGEDVVSAALGWLEDPRRSGRFFIWVHLYDPHRWKQRVREHRPEQEPLWPGETPEGFLARVARLHGVPEPEPGRFRFAWNSGTQPDEGSDPALEFLRCIDAYDGLVLSDDRQIERLYRGVESLASGRTLWIVTSDHGEGLASHGTAGHGEHIYQEQLRALLLVHASDDSLSARRRTERVGHVDLFPTLVETLGLRVEGREGVYDGRSLWPLLRDAPTPWPPRVLFAERRPSEGDNDLVEGSVYALLDGVHKFILHEPGEDEFFDLSVDSRELENRAGKGAPEEERLRFLLQQRLRALEDATPAPSEEVPEAWLEELRELGYAR